MSLPASTTLRECRLCLQIKSASQYRVQRRRNDKEYHSTYCNECHRKLQVARRTAMKEKGNHRRTVTLWAQLARHCDRRRCLFRIIEPVWRAFGGSTGIGQMWAQALKESTATQRVRGCEGMMAILDWLAKNPEPSEDLKMLSDSQLQQSVQDAQIDVLRQLIQESPDLVDNCLKEFGWQLAIH